MRDLAARLQALRAAVDEQLCACGRAPGSVTIVGVSKKQPASAIAEAVAAGLRDVGENYVQEAKAKFAVLRSFDTLRTGFALDDTSHRAHAGTPHTELVGARHPERVEGVRKHFIGHVQRNKAKAIAEIFDVVQSVDRLDAGLALAKAAEALEKRLGVLVQVNISPADRFGCEPGEAPDLAAQLRGYESLRVEGVMAIGPITEDREEIRAAFDLAAKTFAAVGGSTLSIGMSGDWREAIAAGSTMIRIGTALFGERRYGE